MIKKVQLGVILIIISAIIKTLALWLIFIWVVQKILGKPLLRFTKEVGNVQLDQLSSSEIHVFQNQSNELNFLQRTFNTMISDLSQSHHELDSLNRTLEQKVEERTLETKQALEQLKKTQTQLVQSEKMSGLGTLVAGVAHEINNPVNSIHITTHNLEKNLIELNEFIFELGGEDAKDRFEELFGSRFEQLDRNVLNLKEGSLRIKNIVQDLRTFSHLNEAEKKQVNLVEGIRTTIRLLKAQYKEIEFIENYQIQPEMECWPAQLNQVYMNMMTNACQAIQKKYPSTNGDMMGKLWIRTLSWGKKEHPQIAIQFEDNGCGMSEEVQSQIFDPFFTTKDVGEGTGLGMSISYGIVEKHHGTITVQSKENQGTAITILLPLQI